MQCCQAKERIETELREKIKGCESITYESFKNITGSVKLTSSHANDLKMEMQDLNVC